MRSDPAIPDSSSQEREQFEPAPVEVERAVSTALAIASGQAPTADIAASAEAAPSLEVRERQSKKNEVLCRKAMERTVLLEKSSWAMIDASKALVSKSRQRKARVLQSLERLRAA